MTIAYTPRILVTGSNGQIGTVLVKALRERHGTENVIASDLVHSEIEGPFEIINILDTERIESVIEKYDVTEIYHLAALLSSKGEQKIELTWDINLNSYLSILNLARKHKVKKIFFPSTIGVFGPTTPRQLTPQDTVLLPGTVYGISKLTGELWNQYYRTKFDMDIRSIRYPGVISYEVIPTGGTTDFAVEIFFDAILKGRYKCYLSEDTTLPMVYMPDVINATLKLMSAPKENISISYGYNISGFSVSPKDLYHEIIKKIPNFKIKYKTDQRQKIADSWSETIDDSLARKDWGWSPEFDVASMSEDMIKNIKT